MVYFCRGRLALSALALALALVLAIGLPLQTRAGPQEEIAAAEELARQTWIEGLPYALARNLSSAGVARLAELLADPAEREWHANAITALGMSGHRDAFAVLSEFADRPRTGEVDRTTYRALNALPFAMGHLARVEPRALARLEAAIASDAIPAWRYKHLSGERLRDQIHTSCITGLGLAGRADRLRALRAPLQSRGRAGSPRARHLAEAEALAERVVREGPEQVFREVGRGRPGR